MADDMQEMFEQLMRINEQAFAGHQFDVAYHALAAALHCAEASKDEVGLQRVQDVAAAQSTWIDRNAPNYQHSTQSAKSRGHKSIFATLAHQASIRSEIVHRSKRAKA